MKAPLHEEEEEPPEQAGRRRSGGVSEVDLNVEYGKLGNYGEYEFGGKTRAIRANLLDLNDVGF